MFDIRFNEMMAKAIEYEMVKREGKPIGKGLQKRLEKLFDWINNLSDEDYSKLIH